MGWAGHGWAIRQRLPAGDDRKGFLHEAERAQQLLPWRGCLGCLFGTRPVGICHFLPISWVDLGSMWVDEGFQHIPTKYAEQWPTSFEGRPARSSCAACFISPHTSGRRPHEHLDEFLVLLKLNILNHGSIASLVLCCCHWLLET